MISHPTTIPLARMTATYPTAILGSWVNRRNITSFLLPNKGLGFFDPRLPDLSSIFEFI
jgi:hypothetical protein